MIFWIVMAALTAAATAVLLLPLFRSRATVGAHESEIAIYRDQLQEIERDVERGVLPESEAKAARTEIARRLIHVGEQSTREAEARPMRRRAALVIGLAVVPVVSIGAYLYLGAPNTPDRPFVQRIDNPDPADVYVVQEIVAAVLRNPQGVNIDGLRELVDQAILANPDHPAMWEALAYVAVLQQRHDDVLTAFDRFVELDESGGPAAEGLGAELGQLTFLITTTVTGPAEVLFDRVLRLNPSNLTARVFHAVALTERGEVPAAVIAWEAILADEPPGGADWADFAREQLAGLLGEAVVPPDPVAPIIDLPPAEQAEFIRQMVERLATQLATDPDNAAGWVQLITSYIVLGREDEARTALATARDFFTGNAEALGLIEEAARPLME